VCLRCNVYKGETQWHGQTDVAIIRAVRGAVGSAVSLQMDANGAYPTADSAASVIEALNAAGVAVVEDLIGIDRETELQAAKSRLTGRTMLDKESYWPWGETMLQRGLVDIVN
jgi:L-alanine-DL-glutamate epimerase-like enolase superfamily enzyme